MARRIHAVTQRNDPRRLLRRCQIPQMRKSIDGAARKPSPCVAHPLANLPYPSLVEATESTHPQDPLPYYQTPRTGYSPSPCARKSASPSPPNRPSTHLQPNKPIRLAREQVPLLLRPRQPVHQHPHLVRIRTDGNQPRAPVHSKPPRTRLHPVDIKRANGEQPIAFLGAGIIPPGDDRAVLKKKKRVSVHILTNILLPPPTPQRLDPSLSKEQSNSGGKKKRLTISPTHHATTSPSSHVHTSTSSSPNHSTATRVTLCGSTGSIPLPTRCGSPERGTSRTRAGAPSAWEGNRGSCTWIAEVHATKKRLADCARAVRLQRQDLRGGLEEGEGNCGGELVRVCSSHVFDVRGRGGG